MGPRLKLASFLLASALAGCGGQPKLTDLALGKVVVYRNGVAYFERYATVEHGEISLVIAESKVNDLLKSLKVEDVETGKALPMTFPGRKQGHGVVHMKIRVPGNDSRRVKLSYVSESPAWKPTYRLDIDHEGKLVLQGWAIVDNVSGEDWKQVAVGVGSTSALSFRYDLWTVRDVHRQTLGVKERLASAPPTATGLIRPAAGQEIESTPIKQGIVLSREYVANIPVPGRTFESALGAAAGAQGDPVGVSFSGSTALENQYVIDGVNTTSISYGTTGSAKMSQRSQAEIEAERKRKELAIKQQQVAQAEAAKMSRRNDEMATELLASEGNFIIEGIASPSEQNAQQIALSMANHLRNELITRGVPPTRVSVETRIGAIGEPTTLALRPEEAAAFESDESAVGESKFLSLTPVSIPNEGSSMVSILDSKTTGSIVYLYDALSLHGNKDFAFKSILFSNPTQQHLEGGPITVYGEDSFIGEGLTEAIAPGDETILPFALDKQVHVKRAESFSDTVVGFEGVIADGAIVSKERQSTIHFSIHNRGQQKATVFLRHDSARGWKLKKGPTNTEQVGSMNVFKVELAAGAQENVEIVEVTPITATLDLTTDAGVEELASYLRRNKQDTRFTEAGTTLVKAHRTISKNLKRINHVAGQLAMLRGRMDELHMQLVTLEAVKTRGQIIRTLQSRMASVSKQVQNAVMEIVDLREQIMVDRFAYRDLIAQMVELTAGL
jgi:hypothetical protein